MQDKQVVRQELINKRVAMGLTQKNVAIEAGIERSSYTAIERGLRKPSLKVAQKICNVLKMSVDEAFPNED